MSGDQGVDESELGLTDIVRLSIDGLRWLRSPAREAGELPDEGEVIGEDYDLWRPLVETLRARGGFYSGALPTDGRASEGAGGTE